MMVEHCLGLVAMIACMIWVKSVMLQQNQPLVVVTDCVMMVASSHDRVVLEKLNVLMLIQQLEEVS